MYGKEDACNGFDQRPGLQVQLGRKNLHTKGCQAALQRHSPARLHVWWVYLNIPCAVLTLFCNSNLHLRPNKSIFALSTHRKCNWTVDISTALALLHFGLLFHTARPPEQKVLGDYCMEHYLSAGNNLPAERWFELSFVKQPFCIHVFQLLLGSVTANSHSRPSATL